jgi:hypothetical protein
MWPFPKKKKGVPRAVKRRRLGRSTDHVSVTDAPYTADELEFLKAIDAYKRKTGRPCPTLEEILTLARGLGWSRTAEPTPEYAGLFGAGR